MAEKYPFEPWKRDAEKLKMKKGSNSINYSDWLKQDGSETIRAIHDEILGYYANKAEELTSNEEDRVIKITTEIRIEHKPQKSDKKILCLEDPVTGDQIFLDENRNLLFVRKASDKARVTDVC